MAELSMDERGREVTIFGTIRFVFCALTNL